MAKIKVRSDNVRSIGELKAIGAKQDAIHRQMDQMLEQKKMEVATMRESLYVEIQNFREAHRAEIRRSIEIAMELAQEGLPWWQRAVKSVKERAGLYIAAIEELVNAESERIAAEMKRLDDEKLAAAEAAKEQAKKDQETLAKAVGDVKPEDAVRISTPGVYTPAAMDGQPRDPMGHVITDQQFLDYGTPSVPGVKGEPFKVVVNDPHQEMVDEIKRQNDELKQKAEDDMRMKMIELERMKSQALAKRKQLEAETNEQIRKLQDEARAKQEEIDRELGLGPDEIHDDTHEVDEGLVDQTLHDAASEVIPLGERKIQVYE